MKVSKTIRLILTVALCVVLGVVPSKGISQYMYLDSNHDGLFSEADSLNARGTTSVDIWLVTNQDRTGAALTCPSAQPLTISSYEVILRATGGEALWGTYANAQPSMTTSFGTRSGGLDFYTGFAGGDPLAPGKYKLGTLTVSSIFGSPALAIVPNTGLSGAYYTSFGSACEGAGQNNTMILGTDWHDVDGLSAGTGTGSEEPETVQASGSGFLFFRGNEIPGPWTLTYRQGLLSINGYRAASTPRQGRDGAKSVERSREREFIRRASAFADSLKSTDLNVTSATRLLEEFCRSIDLGATVSSTPGRVQLLFRSGVAVVLSSRRNVPETPARLGPAVDSNKAMLRTLARHLQSGEGVLLTNIGTWTLVPASRVSQVREALLQVQRGGVADTTALKSLPARDRTAIRSPATLVR